MIGYNNILRDNVRKLSLLREDKSKYSLYRKIGDGVVPYNLEK